MPKCSNYASNMHMHIHIMHIQAYPSMSAWMCILVQAIPTRIWMITGYCMTLLCWICIRMNIWKKPNFKYDYMHIWVLSGFISRIFDISRQHWLAPWVKSFSFKLFLFQKSQIWFSTYIYRTQNLVLSPGIKLIQL